MSKRGLVNESRDGSSWSRRAVVASIVPYFTNSSTALFITLNDRYDGPFQARRSVEGLRSIILKILEIWVLGLQTDHCDELEGQTIVALTVRRGLL